MAWSTADLVIRQGLQLIIVVILARLLSPADFGVIALLALVLAIATALVDGGLATALIQKQDATPAHQAAVFWFNLCIGLLLAVIMSITAAPLADFYGIPDLRGLTIAVSLSVLLQAAGAIHVTLLSKALNFRTQLQVGLISTLGAGAVAILLALKGLGVWALAMQMVAASALSTMSLWWLHSWRPTGGFQRVYAAELFQLARYIVVANVVEALFSRLHTLLIGKWHGVRELGLYSRAESSQQIPAGVLTTVLSRITLPVFSAAAADRDRLRQAAREALRGVMFVSTPIMLWLAAVASPLIVGLFGEAWRESAPLFAILCLAGASLPLHVINLNVLIATGHGARMLRIEMIKKLLGLVLIVVGVGHGTLGLAWAIVALAAIGFGVNAWHSHRIMGYGALAQLRDIAPILALTLPPCAVANLLATTYPLNLLLVMVIGATVGAVYVATAWSLRLEALFSIRKAISTGSKVASSARRQ